MKLKNLAVKNFRALEEISIDFDSRVNVVVGPNAVGKTTLLEAIRLAKGLLAPRTQNESNQVLFGLGASSPHNPQKLIYDAIASDPLKILAIKCSFALADDEVAFLLRDESLNQVAAQMVFAGLGRNFANPAESISFFSKPGSQQVLAAQVEQLRGFVSAVASGGQLCRLDLTIDPRTGQIISGDPVGQALISFLDRALPPNRTKFSYFAADRAIPAQDPPVQIGVADAANQLESHSSQPHLKYQRLKSTIFNAIVEGKDEARELEREFEKVFGGVMKGKRLERVGVNEHGLLKIEIWDEESQRRYAIDAMSSGEKGLILTFLLMARTVERGGIVILDEPELHLNPAVCRGLLSFLVEQYAIARDIQFVICSHSPEILGGAFDRDDCALYHLISGKLITPVRKQDLAEVGEALQRLGTSHSETLLYRGTVFVEGVQDSELLEAGFEDLFRRYKFKDLRGRGNVENEIRFLQAAESRAKTGSKHYFVFDRDQAPTDLVNTDSVRVLQWGRRCLENYLIDIGILTDLLKEDQRLATHPVRNVGELQQKLKGLAMSQLDAIAIREAYQAYSLTSPGLRASEMQGKGFQDAAEVLFARIGEIKSQVCGLDRDTWKRKFVEDCERQKSQLQESWDATWHEHCDGKKLFSDLQRELGIKESIARFKKQVIVAMKVTKTEGWRAMESLLKGLMEK